VILQHVRRPRRKHARKQGGDSRANANIPTVVALTVNLKRTPILECLIIESWGLDPSPINKAVGVYLIVLHSRGK
jgi:hypothetical protein